MTTRDRHADDIRETERQTASRFLPPLAGPVERSAAALAQYGLALQLGGLRFMARRIEDNIKVLEMFQAARSATDLIAVQRAWWTQMLSTYAEEGARFGSLAAGLLRPQEPEAESAVAPKAPDQSSAKARQASTQATT